MSIESIALWHQRAKPEPTARDFDVQLGCHFEEFVEQLDSIGLSGRAQAELQQVRDTLHWLATGLKQGTVLAHITDRKEFLDAAADQIVTATGAAYRAGMDIGEAVHRVNRSNWSKYDEDGQPLFDANGKIAKGPRYQAPDLTGLY